MRRLHTLASAWISRARHVFLSKFLLNSFWINCSLPLACFLSFQTFLSNVLSRFHLLRDVNLSVCPKWWLTFDTENPVTFVTLQASNVMRLHTLIFALGFSGASRIFIWRPWLNSNYMIVIQTYVWTDDLQLTLTIGLFSISNFFLNYQWVICTMWFSSSSFIPVQWLLLNSFWRNCSLPLACSLSFQTFLSNNLSRFHLLRDVNLSVCLKWWLTFDTENPGIFVTSQASNVMRLHTLIFALGFSGASRIFIWRPLLNSHYMMVIQTYIWTDDLQLTLTIGLFSISNFFLNYQWSMCTFWFSSSSCIPVQCLLLN